MVRMGEKGFGPYLPWNLAKRKPCPFGFTHQPRLSSHNMELLSALCRACFSAEEVLSAGEALLSRKGLPDLD